MYFSRYYAYRYLLCYWSSPIPSRVLILKSVRLPFRTVSGDATAATAAVAGVPAVLAEEIWVAMAWCRWYWYHWHCAFFRWLTNVRIWQKPLPQDSQENGLSFMWTYLQKQVRIMLENVLKKKYMKCNIKHNF